VPDVLETKDEQDEKKLEAGQSVFANAFSDININNSFVKR
jgi:hypothetical protein